MREVWWISLIKALVIVNLVMLAFAYTTWFERKLLGRMQNRYGPNRAGPYGLLQPIADLVKLIRKESFFPQASIDAPYILAPIISMFTALAAFSEIPFGDGWNRLGSYRLGERGRAWMLPQRSRSLLASTLSRTKAPLRYCRVATQLW